MTIRKVKIAWRPWAKFSSLRRAWWVDIYVGDQWAGCNGPYDWRTAREMRNLNQIAQDALTRIDTP